MMTFYRMHSERLMTWEKAVRNGIRQWACTVRPWSRNSGTSRIHGHKCSVCLPLAKSWNKVSVIEPLLNVFLLSVCRSMEVVGWSKCYWHQGSSAWSNDVSKILTLKLAQDKNDLSLPTMLCCFWQSFEVSDKRFPFAPKLCRFLALGRMSHMHSFYVDKYKKKQRPTSMCLSFFSRQGT